MIEEVMRYLDPEPGEVIVDCTVGEGGHASRILGAIRPGGRLIGIDQDEEVLARAKEKLKDYDGLYTLLWENFKNLDSILKRLKVTRIDGALFDLGLSSFQLEAPARGFSFQREAPLDMRMDKRRKITAFDLVNHLAQAEMSKILMDFGEERWSNRIARQIVRARKNGPITTTTQLAEIVRRAVPDRNRYKRIHPATRTFQAFRIVVNQELEALETGLSATIEALAEGSMVLVISFHSLEDRIVKNKFKKFAKAGVLEILTKKPIRPQADEVRVNPRCRSARLRVGRKKR